MKRRSFIKVATAGSLLGVAVPSFVRSPRKILESV